MIFLAGEIQCFMNIKKLIDSKKFDFYAADGGYLLAEKFQIKPQCILGDFDSAQCPQGENIMIFPCEKDETDSELALNLAMKKGYHEIWLIAPFGGRLDHTIANLSLLERGRQAGIQIFLYDGMNLAFSMGMGLHHLDCRFRYISFFAIDKCAKISLNGFKYELEHYQLETGVPIGISNEPTFDPVAQIHCGRVLCICTEKDHMEEL